jgi:5-methylcytosine-specific restriction protein A
MVYARHYLKTIPDKHGNPRQGIIFKLAETDTTAFVDTPSPETAEGLGFLSSRVSAIEAARDVAEKVKTAQERRKRSQTISKYVQERALGYCEVCGYAAPFHRSNGTPYLESHHITQLADDGPDAPGDVVAACPTCHRKVKHCRPRKNQASLGGNRDQSSHRGHRSRHRARGWPRPHR